MSNNEKIYEVITNKVKERLENAIKNGERFNWIKAWHGEFTGNAITKHRYRGINALLLEGQYISFKQLQEFQAKHPEKEFEIKKGSHKNTVYFYKFSKITEEDEETGEMISKVIPLVRFYQVFSIHDVENLEEYFKVEQNEHTFTDAMKQADLIIKDYCNRDNLTYKELEGSDRCFYRPSTHSVTVPLKSQFNTPEEFYGAAFHELAHSTAKHLCRDQKGYFGDKDYSFEELVAELTSQMIMNYLGISTESVFDNSVAYLQNWLSKLDKEDVSFIVSASNKAQKAADYILNMEYVKNESDAA